LGAGTGDLAARRLRPAPGGGGRSRGGPGHGPGTGARRSRVETLGALAGPRPRRRSGRAVVLRRTPGWPRGGFRPIPARADAADLPALPRGHVLPPDVSGERRAALAVPLHPDPLRPEHVDGRRAATDGTRGGGPLEERPRRSLRGGRRRLRPRRHPGRPPRLARLDPRRSSVDRRVNPAPAPPDEP